ncbi:MAG: VTT domain-containing protein [Polyangiaceae bacterium]|nr:VTT domain-containing protein [Polyangiaceae bacterium]
MTREPGAGTPELDTEAPESGSKPDPIEAALEPARSEEPEGDAPASEPPPELDPATRQRRRLHLTLLLGGMVAVGIMGTVGTALSPKLLANYPLLLIALAPGMPNLVTVAPATELVPFLGVAVLRLLLADPLYFALGRWFHKDAVAWAERRAGRFGATIRELEEAFSRWGSPLVLIFPYGIVCLLAGASKMTSARFWTLNVIGTLGTALVVRLFGESLSSPIARLTGWVDSNSTWLTYVIVGIIVVSYVARRLGGKQPSQGIDQEIDLDSRR